MKWPWQKMPKGTPHLESKFVCSRCGAKFINDPETYCPECKFGIVVGFVKKEDKKVDLSLFGSILRSNRDKTNDRRDTGKSTEKS